MQKFKAVIINLNKLMVARGIVYYMSLKKKNLIDCVSDKCKT